MGIYDTDVALATLDDQVLLRLHTIDVLRKGGPTLLRQRGGLQC
jgi:hypothetical protein